MEPDPFLVGNQPCCQPLYVLAHMWFNLAAAQGDKQAAADRDAIAAKMTPDQIAEAQRMARDWKPATQNNQNVTATPPQVEVCLNERTADPVLGNLFDCFDDAPRQ